MCRKLSENLFLEGERTLVNVYGRHALDISTVRFDGRIKGNLKIKKTSNHSTGLDSVTSSMLQS